jgi:hypothetical protein
LLHCTNRVAGELFLPNCCLGFAKATQRQAITHEADPAILALATPSITNPVAVADIEPIPGAVLPDRVLDEPGKGLRKRWIELPGIDPLGYGCNNVGAAARPVADRTIQVFKLCTNVSMAIMLPPTSVQRTIFLGAPSRRADRDMARTLSETP